MVDQATRKRIRAIRLSEKEAGHHLCSSSKIFFASDRQRAYGLDSTTTLIIHMFCKRERHHISSLIFSSKSFIIILEKNCNLIFYGNENRIEFHRKQVLGVMSIYWVVLLLARSLIAVDCCSLLYSLSM